LTGVPLPHFVPNAGIRVQAGEIGFAYSGDTAPDPMLAELGRKTDLFIIESTDRDGETQRPERNLMTSAEAGRFGRQAGARRLMLTHFWPGTDRAASVAAAFAEFGGDVLEATEGLTVSLMQ
jgi:ribonuclease BN (tRNA processing enzyme)